MSFQGLYFKQSFFSFRSVPVFHQFVIMQVKPFKYQTGSATRQLACDDTVLNGNLALVFVVPYMKMRRLMLLIIHVDNDTVKTTYFWHNDD